MNRSSSLGIGLALVAIGCSAPPGQDDGNLVGGTPATVDDVPSTLQIVHNCTVAKVADDVILVAAHCVDDRIADDGVSWRFVAGMDLVVSHARQDPHNDPFEVRIVRTVIHPAWLNGWIDKPNGVNVLGPNHPPDLALVLLDNSEPAPDTPAHEGWERWNAIPVTPIDANPVMRDDELTILGYGCENGIDAAVKHPLGFPQLKTHPTYALDAEALDHPGSFIPRVPADLQRVADRYVVTPGAKHPDHPGQASLCPGDSGGPLYTVRGGEPYVVGVNAYYSFLPASADPDRISFTNWHTRLDVAAPVTGVDPSDGVTPIAFASTGNFLAKHGAQVVDSVTGEAYTYDGNVDDPIKPDLPDEGCARLLLNEIAPTAICDDDEDCTFDGLDEFVEITNTGSCAMSLEGARLLYGGKGLKDSSSNEPLVYWAGTAADGVPPGGYFIIGGHHFDFTGFDTPNGRGQLAPHEGFAESGGMRLRSGPRAGFPDGEVLDGVAYGADVHAQHRFREGAPFDAFVGPGKAAARLIENFQPRDTDDNASDFVVQHPTPNTMN